MSIGVGMRSPCISIVLFLSGVAGVCLSQEPSSDPVVVYNLAASAIAQEKWDEGLKAVDHIIQVYGKDGGKEAYGPVFGHFYYLRGLLMLGKKDYNGAIESFKTTYEEFPNDTLKSEPGGKNNKQPNLYRNSALVQWANIEMFQEKYADAVTRYEKALEESGDDSNVNRIYVAVNLGRCRIKAGDIEGGYNLINPALKNPQSSEGLKQAIFMILAQDWSPQVDFATVRSFLNEHRNIVTTGDPEERLELNSSFQGLAQESFAKQEPIRALAWYHLMIDPLKLAPDLNEEIKALEERQVSPEMEAKKTEYLTELRGKSELLSEQSRQLLNGVGSAYFQMKNFAAAYVAFSKLSDEVPGKHKDRPVYLHNAVTSAAQLSRWAEAYQYGKIFLEDYEDHELMPAVGRVLVEIVFLRGEYQEAYEISNQVRKDMELGSKIRDIPDFVAAASAFHLENIEEAESELQSYLAAYPDGQRLEPAHFYNGLTKVRLAKWEEAAGVFNQFLEKYPKSAMVPPSLFQGALSEFMLDQFEPSLAKVERVITEFPDHEVAAKAWNLKGDIFSSEGRGFAEVESCYLKGKELAAAIPGDGETAAYALWQLTIHSSDENLWDTAIAHIDEFQSQYSDSVYRLDHLAASLPALTETERREEGLARLREVLQDFGDKPESGELAEMFGSYFDFLKENYSTEEVRAELNSQIESNTRLPALTGWLRVALYGLAEGGKDDSVSKEERDQEFYRLNVNFDPSQHSNYVITQLARWNARTRKDTVEAQRLYDYIIENRPGTSGYGYALVDTAEILSNSDDPAQRELAMARFHQAFSELEDDELKELSVLGVARLLMKDKKFAEAQVEWEKYLENRSWTVSRPEANYEFARCLDEQGKTADALKIYVSVYVNFPGHLDWSTRAYVRTAIITRDSGEDLKSLLVLRDMLQRMGHHEHPVVEQAKKLFTQWKSEYQPAASQEKQG